MNAEVKLGDDPHKRLPSLVASGGRGNVKNGARRMISPESSWLYSGNVTELSEGLRNTSRRDAG